MDGGTEVYGTLVSDIQTDVSVTGKPVYLTASGNDITVDVKKGNMTNPVVTMNPIQNLNGYDNPWVGGAGKNLLDVQNLENGSFNAVTGEPTSTLYRVRTKTGILLKSGTYTLSTTTENANIVIYVYDTNGVFIPEESYVQWSATNYRTITLTGERILAFAFRLSTETIITVNDIKEPQLESGSTVTEYAPYENICPIYPRTKTEISVNGSVITREYGQEIYGGTDEIAEGVVTEKYKIVDLGDLSWQYNSNWGGHSCFYTLDIRPDVKKPSTTLDKINAFSDQYENYSRNELYFLDGYGMAFNPNGDLNIRDYRYSSATDFKTAMKGHYVCFELATPVEILTTKGYVPLDKGTNEIIVSNNDIITFDYCSTLAGKISGTLSYIEDGLAPSGYLSGSGNFLALHLDSEDWDIYTSVKVGLYPNEGSGMVEILTDEEKICVGKITSNDQVFMVESTDGTLTKTDVYSLSDLVLETE